MAVRTEKSDPPAVNVPPSVTRSEDFLTVYANNVNFESSVWDLKLIFGTLDQPGGQARIEQSIGVTIPWLQAKLLSVYLAMQLAGFEAENGKIQVPERMMPQLPPSHEANKKNPATKNLAEAIEAVFRKRLEELK